MPRKLARIGTVAALFVAPILAMPTMAFAASTVTLTADTTVVLPADGVSYTLNSGGTFDQLDISGGTMTFTMTSGESVTITAPSNQVMSNDGGFAYSCSGRSTLTLNPSASITVNVTPSGGCSGSGGGGSIATTPSTSATTATASVTASTTVTAATSAAKRTPVAGLSEVQVQSILTLMRAFSADQSVIDAVDAALHGETAAFAGAKNQSFARDLTQGARGADVRALQAYLNTHGVRINAQGSGAPGHETEFFGALTKVALAKFQKLSGISPASGYFGSLTRAFIGAHP